MALDTSSVQTSLSATLQRKLNAEISAFRQFTREQSVGFYTHLNQIAAAAAALNGLTASATELNKVDGIATTGGALSFRHKTASSVGFQVRSTVAGFASSFTWNPGFTKVLGGWGTYSPQTASSPIYYGGINYYGTIAFRAQASTQGRYIRLVSSSRGAVIVPGTAVNFRLFAVGY